MIQWYDILQASPSSLVATHTSARRRRAAASPLWSFRGKRLHTRNRHFRNRSWIFSGIFQWIVSGIFWRNLTCQRYFPKDWHLSSRCSLKLSLWPFASRKFQFVFGLLCCFPIFMFSAYWFLLFCLVVCVLLYMCLCISCCIDLFVSQVGLS